MKTKSFIQEENTILRNGLQKEKKRADFYKDVLVNYLNALLIIKENATELSTTIHFNSVTFENKIELDEFHRLIEMKMKDFTNIE